MIDLNKLKFVVLERPYDFFMDNDDAPIKLFSKTMGLKINGYLDGYPYGVLPVSTTDFISTHVLLCVDNFGDLDPIMGWKSCSFDVAEKFNTTPTLTPAFERPGHEKHREFLSTKLEMCRVNGIELFHDSCFTMKKSLKGNPVMMELMVALLGFYHGDYTSGQNAIASGVNRFKMDRYYKKFGYDKIEEIGDMRIKSSFDEPAAIYYLNEIGHECRELADKYSSLCKSAVIMKKERNLEGAVERIAIGA